MQRPSHRHRIMHLKQSFPHLQFPLHDFSQSHMNKREVPEMKICRPTWACGHRLIDHVRNDSIREKLKIENITQRCRKVRLRWFGHVKKDTGDGSTILGRSFEHCVLNGKISEQLVMRREWAKPIYRGWHNVHQERRREEQCVSSLTAPRGTPRKQRRSQYFCLGGHPADATQPCISRAHV